MSDQPSPGEIENRVQLLKTIDALRWKVEGIEVAQGKLTEKLKQAGANINEIKIAIDDLERTKDPLEYRITVLRRNAGADFTAPTDIQVGAIRGAVQALENWNAVAKSVSDLVAAATSIAKMLVGNDWGGA